MKTCRQEAIVNLILVSKAYSWHSKFLIDQTWLHQPCTAQSRGHFDIQILLGIIFRPNIFRFIFFQLFFLDICYFTDCHTSRPTFYYWYIFKVISYHEPFTFQKIVSLRRNAYRIPMLLDFSLTCCFVQYILFSAILKWTIKRTKRKIGLYYFLHLTKKLIT